MTVSIILPSLHEPLGRRCIRNILATSQGHDYEIVVVSPWDAGAVNKAVKWTPETEPQGSIKAAATGFGAATGEYVVQMCEDASPLPGWLSVALGHMKEWSPACVALHQGAIMPGSTQAIGSHGFAGTAFGRLYANFPFMRRPVAANMGWHRSDLYRAHYADVHLGMECWASETRVELSTLPGRKLPQPCVTWETDRLGCPEAPAKGSTREKDWRTFHAYWDGNETPAKPVLAAQGWSGWQADEHEHSVNIDIPPALLPFMLKDRTIVAGPWLADLLATWKKNNV